MIDMTYDPEADAVYIILGRGEIDRQQEAGPFIYDVDRDGRVLGVEILSASKVLAPGEWQHPGRQQRSLAAEGWLSASKAVGSYKFEVYKDKVGEFRFRLKAPNGEPLFNSVGYKTKASAMSAIDSLREHLSGATIEEAA